MSGLLNSNLNSSASNLPDSAGRPFTASFSGQSGSIPGFHHSGLHNTHGSYNIPSMPGTLAQRNAALSGLPSSGVQQPGGSIPGRFPSNNLQVAMSQIPHAHSGVSGRGVNFPGTAFSSGLNMGGNIQGLSSGLGSGGNRNSVHGMSVSPSLGNSGPRIPSSVGNIASGSNIGRNISTSSLSVPSIASRMNLSSNAGGGSLNVQGSSRMMNGLLHQQATPQLINMLGSSYPTSGGSLSQNQIQAGNNSLSSIGMLHDASDTAPFDINDFPQLSGRPSSAGGPQGQYGSLRKQGVGVNTIVQQSQEFSIQNEDFPALPGYKGNLSDYNAMELHHKEQLHENVPVMQAQQYPMSRSGFNLGSSYLPNRQQHQQGANSVQNAGSHNILLRPPNQTSSLGGSYDQFLQQYQQPQPQNHFRLQQMSSAAHSYRDQIQKIQAGPTPPDPYGLLGLLGVIRMNDADLASLALGIDLTTLGLNLNSPDNLYKTFGSPWSNDPAKGDTDFRIPACYFSEQTLPLQPLLFQKFHILTLFYIFYSMPKDEAQLYAANELYNRGWFYHKEVRLWFTRTSNVEPLVKTHLYERGSYLCFDPEIWDSVRKDNFVLHYELVEKRPALPSIAQNIR